MLSVENLCFKFTRVETSEKLKIHFDSTYAAIILGRARSGATYITAIVTGYYRELNRFTAPLVKYGSGVALYIDNGADETLYLTVESSCEVGVLSFVSPVTLSKQTALPSTVQIIPVT